MKRKRRVKWNLLGIIGFLALFILTLYFPAVLPLAKVGAILIYVGVCYGELSYMRYKKQRIFLLSVFCTLATFILIYILFFL